MANLSDKLKALGVKVGARDVPPPAPRRGHPIEEVAPGRFCETPFGTAYVVENVYPPDYRHGSAPLVTTASLATIADWAGDPFLTRGDLDRLVFLDTETTGLAGGTGTFAFLIGIGRLQGDSFHLKQLFMRDPAEERAVLAALTEFLDPLDALVTFNGKAFDAPLLRTRYQMNRSRVPFQDAGHLDLLPLARRLWRDRLASRALGSLETHILGAQRTEEDIPGWLIPSIYFDYLRSGDARPVKGVLYHNAMDVVAMAALLGHMAQLLDQPLGFTLEHGLDVIAIARLFEDLGRMDEAAELYARGLEYDVSEETFRDTMRRLAFLHRRRGDMVSAIDLWHQAAHGQQIYAFVELAKYYEHKARNYPEALRQTRAALAIVHSTDFPQTEGAKWLADLEHRLARLETKLAAR